MKNLIWIVGLTVFSAFFFSGCSPSEKSVSSVSSIGTETRSVKQENVSKESPNLSLKQTPAAQGESELPAVSESIAVKLDDLEAKGVKIGWNPDKTVKSLDLSTGFPDNGFLADDPRLATVRVIRGKGILNAKMAGQLAKMPQLTELLWTATVLSESTQDLFAGNSKLKKVRLSGLRSPKMTETLVAIVRLNALDDLDLSGSAITDADLTSVNGFSTASKLTRLNLYDTAITDSSIVQLVPLADRLVWLNLDATAITDGCAPNLEKFQKLTFLHLGRSKITDGVIPALSKLKNLKTVHITRTGATEKGAAALRQALPQTEVISVFKEK